MAPGIQAIIQALNLPGMIAKNGPRSNTSEPPVAKLLLFAIFQRPLVAEFAALCKISEPMIAELLLFGILRSLWLQSWCYLQCFRASDCRVVATVFLIRNCRFASCSKLPFGCFFIFLAGAINEEGVRNKKIIAKTISYHSPSISYTSPLIPYVIVVLLFHFVFMDFLSLLFTVFGSIQA